MNATTPFALSSEPISDLTRLNLSLEENIKDCRHQLLRCVNDADYARWAREWGGVAVDRVRDTEHLDEDSPTVAEFDELRDAKVAIEDAADTAITEITAVLKGVTGPKTEAINKIVQTLAAALLVSEESDT